jgi:hypothetical protein
MSAFKFELFGASIRDEIQCAHFDCESGCSRFCIGFARINEERVLLLRRDIANMTFLPVQL